MTSTFILLLSMAFVCLGAGLGLFLWVSQKKGQSGYFNTVNVICWLLIALFPVFLVFAFFPGTEVSGTIFGFQVGGAFGAFFLTWYFGIRTSKEAVEMDEMTAKVLSLEQALAEKREIERLDQRVSGKKRSVPIIDTDYYEFPFIKNPNKKIGIATGNIANVRGIDVWVNSENTDMQLARFYDRSISSMIRYLGAKRHPISRQVVEDTIAEEVHAVLGDIMRVEPAAVIVTGSGELARRNQVKRIFHVATAQGQVGQGYRPVENIFECVISALEVAEEQRFKDEGLKTILFPLMGMGTTSGNQQRDLYEAITELMRAAVAHFDNTPDSRLETIYFLAFTERDRDACLKFIAESEQLIYTPIGEG